ncbi:MAG: triose-phosphate isomerase [Hyphomicrobiales bacterium]
MSIKPLVAGNWKMNGLTSAKAEFEAMQSQYDGGLQGVVDLMICPPATLLGSLASTSGAVAVGAQDCHANESGAHTGDLSPEILVDSGASAIIVGHSERRADHGETSELVRSKAQAANRAGATAIICVGETKDEREAGKAEEVVIGQLSASVPDSANAQNAIIAYEPVWAIGTGLTPTADDVRQIHAAIRNALTERFGNGGAEFKILYGGSVKPANASELMGVENVNGALVGGASLKADDFLGIAKSYLG